MNKQISLSAFNDELSEVRTKKKEFLGKIERLIPWDKWVALIQPWYYKGERGNKPYGLVLMIRLNLQQNLYDLSDEKAVAQVLSMLTESGLILEEGTIVDSTIIEAPSSTKNREKKRDPDAHQAKKENTWHFGYKAHIGADRDSGLVHTVKATAANASDASDVAETANLLRRGYLPRRCWLFWS